MHDCFPVRMLTIASKSLIVALIPFPFWISVRRQTGKPRPPV